MGWVKIFRALGHEGRYALFMRLLTGPEGDSCCESIATHESACCVLDLARVLPLAQATISHHLRILVEAGLVKQERRGTYSIYTVDQPMLESMGQFFQGLQVCRGEGGSQAGIKSEA